MCLSVLLVWGANESGVFRARLNSTLVPETSVMSSLYRSDHYTFQMYILSGFFVLSQVVDEYLMGLTGATHASASLLPKKHFVSTWTNLNHTFFSVPCVARGLHASKLGVNPFPHPCTHV